MRLFHVIDSLGRDLRYGARMLLKDAGFTGAVVATLALGIGGITAVFSVVHAVLLAPLPYESPGQLVRVYQEAADREPRRNFVSAVHFAEIRDQVGSFEDIAALANYSETGRDLVHEGRAERVRVLSVTSGYFNTLRAGPLRGREFGRDDEADRDMVVLSEALWRSRFGGDESILGRTVHLSAEPYVVIGVAPAAFEDPIVGEVDAWLPYNLPVDRSEENYSLSVVGRLRTGVSVTQAHAELAALSGALAERWPNVTYSALVMEPLREDLVATSRGTLNLLSVAVALVLLVACVNVANLLLVRASGRNREFAIRSALGSGGARIARQVLAESALLALLGGLAGLVLGTLTLRALLTLGRNAIPRFDDIGLDPVALTVTASVTLAVGVAFGLLPAVRSARVQPTEALHQRSSTRTRSQGRLRRGLAATQLALALMLLVGAGGLLASFYRLQGVDLGFRSERVLTFDLSLPAARYDAERRAAFQEELARRLETIPAVSHAGGTSRLPGTGRYHPWATTMLSGPRAGDLLRGAQQRVVSGQFFAALEIPLLVGRVFDARDDADAPARAVVSAQFAGEAFPEMPLARVAGQRIRVAGREEEIIGVVGDVTLDARGTPAAAVYRSHRQFADNRNWALTQVVATELASQPALAAVRAEVAALDPELVVYDAAPLAEVVGRGVARERFALVLMGIFAIVALTLSAVGLYGVLSYSVRQRRHEIGIRIVIGATAAHVRHLVLREAAVVVAIGIAAGLGGALVLGRWLSSLLYGVSPSDPLLVLATTLLLVVVALVATWLPARRASRVETRIAMQEE